MSAATDGCKGFFCVLCIMLCLFGCLGRKGAAPEAEKRVTLTKEAAVERALEALGLPREGLVVTAKAVSLPDRPLPSVEAPENREGWLIHVDGVKLTGKEGYRIVSNPYVHSFDVVVSSATGQVVSVTSPAPLDDPDVWPFPSIESYERQMARSSNSFAGLPESPAKVTLRQALEKAHGGYHSAKQIIAYYVVFRRTLPKVDERAVWMVHLRGLPPMVFPMPRGGEPGPVHGRNHMCTRVDAMTGEFRGASNMPHPNRPSAAPDNEPVPDRPQ